jgi:hypothetical protein
MVKRKRAPGGGRKPKGPISGKSAWLSTRISNDTRQRLDQAAKQNDRSLSQEIELRLRRSFAEKVSDPYLKGLAFLIRQAAEAIPTSQPLQSSPYKFAVFKAAVDMLLTHLTPPGPIEPPPEAAEQHEYENYWKSPALCGRAVADVVWWQLQSVETPPSELMKYVDAADQSWWYAHPHARQDLGVPAAPMTFTLGGPDAEMVTVRQRSEKSGQKEGKK